MEDGLRNAGVGKGIYALAEASALTSIPARRIRRWFRGYHFKGRQGEPGRSLAVIRPEFEAVDGILQLSFLDLIEMRFVDAFLAFGVSWPELRRAASAASELLGHARHPFSTRRFKTDGHRIFGEVTNGSGGPVLLQIRDRQQVFRGIVAPLFKNLEFDERQAVRWWYLGEKRHIVIDPDRAFGKPVGARSGVPARILSDHAERHGVRATANWYEVDSAEVRDALVFAQRIAA